MRPISLLLSLILLLSLAGCSGIKMLSQEDIYRPEFLKKIDGIQAIYRNGGRKSAINKLMAIDNQLLNRDEKAKKYNLLGVFSFSNAKYVQSLEYFLIAKKAVELDKSLEAQIGLNLASTYYKQGKLDNAYESIKQVDKNNLAMSDDRKFYMLKYVLSSHMEQSKEVVISLINLLRKSKSFEEVKQSKYIEALLDNFRKLADSERVYLLEDYFSETNLVVAYLAQNEVLQRYYMGDKNGAADVLRWLDSKYDDQKEVASFVKDFRFRMDNFSKINAGSIGVVLPFTGNYSVYAKNALVGIETAINTKENIALDIKIHSRDNHNNPFVARQMIQELVQSHHVSMIIGGLHPNTAKEEYLEARKYGVIYISLSPVYVDKDLKNHLLIEIPGSVQSQLATIFSDRVLAKFGNKVAVFYPNQERGSAYIDEIWKTYNNKSIKLKGVQSFEKNLKDFRDPVKNLLGLKYKRERLEELEYVTSVHALEAKTKRSSVRRTQHLEPVTDFDWVFVPSYPHEAVQILPSFRYFDANNVTFIGGPDWLNKKVLREQPNLGRTLYFVGNNPEDFDQTFMDFYKQRNKRIPRLLEIKAYEAMNISLKIINNKDLSKRDELDSKILQMKRIQGVTGNWNLFDGLWIKEMDFLKVSRGKVQEVNLTEKAL